MGEGDSGVRRGKAVLRDKRGASMLFVLAAMLLLMAIGVSALTAAGANFGAAVDKRNENQLNLYVNSMELTLIKALENEALRNRILEEVYDDEFSPIPLVPDYLPEIFDISVSVDKMRVSVPPASSTLAIPAQPPSPGCVCGPDDPIEDCTCPPASPGSPAEYDVTQTATISGNVIVTVKASYRGLTVVSVMTYQCNGGRLQGTVRSVNRNIDVPRSAMQIVNRGNWEFQQHQRVSWQAEP
jgi:hypothetical protein